MAINILTPIFPSFYDLEGLPLENGSVFIGEPSKNAETNQIDVFFDEALTIPAAQPLKTSSGYIVRNGTPANVFIRDTYSITVKDKKGVVIYVNLLVRQNVTDEFEDVVFRVIDEADGTKKIAFQASAITTGTTRTITMPDTDVDLGDVALLSGSTFSGSIILENTIGLSGKEVGGANRELLSVNASDEALIGATNILNKARGNWDFKDICPTSSIAPTLAAHLTRKDYVDALVTLRLNNVNEEYTGQPAGEKILKQAGANIQSQCTAWVKFDGITGTIIDSFNVVSIVKNSTGNYDVDFEEAMDDRLYWGVGGASTQGSASTTTPSLEVSNDSTPNAIVITRAVNATTNVLADYNRCFVVFFGGKN